jgi:hypothetical protein
MRIGRILITPTLLNVPLSENKSLELQIGKGSDWRLFDLRFSWSHKRDHSGPQFDLEIYKLVFFTAKIYDVRHWNAEKKRWYEPGEQYSNYIRRIK